MSNFNLDKSYKYINWRQAAYVNLSDEEFYNKLIYFKDNGDKAISKTRFDGWFTPKRCSYAYDKKGDYQYLYTYDYSGNYSAYNNVFVVYTTNMLDTDKNGLDVRNRGKEALRQIKAKFKELNNKVFFQAFGCVDEEYKICVPRQLAYHHFNKDNNKPNYFMHVGSIDGCSQYPSNLCGLLPDSATAITVDGVVEPNAEYQFAFYLQSGHSAQYNVYNTRDWSELDLQPWLFTKQQHPFKVDEKTVLMKASKYTLNDVMAYFYQQKEKYQHETPEYELAKLVINGAIGEMHTKTYTNDKYAHLATVAIARSNNKILKLVDNIGLNSVVQICVDGIIYQGDKKYGVDKKELGAMYQEFTDCRMRIDQFNRYVVVDKDGKIVKVKHAGCNWNKKKEELIGEVHSISEMDDWVLLDKRDKIKELVEDVQKSTDN